MNKTETNPNPCVLTIGNFDGVHLGHRKLIETVVTAARSQGIRSCLMTFEPHPLKVLAPQMGVKNIFSLEDKVQTAKDLGIDEVIIIPFSRDLSELSPEDFFKTFVVDQAMATFLVIGHDFSFGKHKSGTLEVLKKLCEKYKTRLQIESPVMVSGVTVSSTAIREFLLSGEIEKAASFLGREFYLAGMVEKGDGRGRQIGFPTANLFTRAELFPKKGVYISWVELKGRKYKGLTNVGDNPTFIPDKKAILKVETHILDFNEDIYGEKLKVNFLSRIRDEKKFEGISQLKSQIEMDIEKGRKYPWKKL